MSHNEAWRRASVQLRAELGEEVFSSWFGRLELDGIENGLARVSAPTRFLKGWVEMHYLDRILAVLKREIGAVTRVQIVMRELARQATVSSDSRGIDALRLNERLGVEMSAGAAASALLTRAPRPSGIVENGAAFGSPLEKRMIFETFLVGRPNQLAHSVARRIAGAAAGSPNNLVYLHGAVGLGKTHLLQAVAHAASAEGRCVAYLTAERFMRDFVSALQGHCAAAFQNFLRSANLLILDNLQSLEGPSARREFAETMNFFIEADRQIVFAADRPPEDLENIDESTRARFARGLCVKLGPPDEDLRTRIIEARVSAFKLANPFFSLSPAVIQFVARTIDTNGRDLDAAIGRLLAHARLTGTQHTVESAQAAVSDLLQPHNPKRVTVEDIQNLVASHYSMTRADLLSAQKTAKVVKPRQVAMYLAKALTPRSLPEIGRRFGGRDHTTVLHAVRKIEKLATVDHTLKDEIEALKHALMRIGLVSSSLLNLNTLDRTEPSTC
jgi:chromosomal replication initiator protein